MRLDPLRSRGQCGIGGRDMAGVFQAFQQLLHGGGLANLAGTNHNLEQPTITPDRLFQVVHNHSLEWIHFHECYILIALSSTLLTR